MSAEVTKCAVSELVAEPNFAALVDEYANECAILGLPNPSGKIDLYETLEKSGAMQVYWARVENTLVGFLVMVFPTNLHYGVCLAATESIFVTRTQRTSGAGDKLIRAAEQKAREVASGLQMIAPIGSDLAEILPRKGYTETNRVFTKLFTKVPAAIPAMSDTAIAKVYKLEDYTRKMPQVKIATKHVIHAGIYTRSICIPAGVLLTGALIKIATTLVVDGDVIVYIDGKPEEFCGHNVLAAEAHRKQAFMAKTDTNLTMFFTTSAKTVEEAEEQFTDEAHLLFSRQDDAINYLTKGD